MRAALTETSGNSAGTKACFLVSEDACVNFEPAPMAKHPLLVTSTAFGSRDGAAAVNSMFTTAGDPVLAFGGDPIKNLLNKIEAATRQGRFSQRPIGPLGSLLSLADDKWAVAVEFAIGRCFNDFLVSSTRDHDVLKVGHRE